MQERENSAKTGGDISGQRELCHRNYVISTTVLKYISTILHGMMIECK